MASYEGQTGAPVIMKHTEEETKLIRAAANLTRELSVASPAIFWGDLLLNMTLGYGALFLVLTATTPWILALSWLVSILALYRVGSFIHELTHLKKTAVPGFRTFWNLFAGVPLMIPSFMYEGTHNQHHARTRYGTKNDPEYLPLALMSVGKLILFMVASLLGPIGLLIRYAIFSPLSLIFPPFRKVVVARFSTLAINPDYRRKMPTGEFRKDWIWMETATSLFAIGLLVLVFTGYIPMISYLTFLAVISVTMFLNQIRTLVAHLWENDGEPINVTEQYLDSVNVPPPGLLPALWAPVGLRFHALHHLIPSVPYHALGEAHRRLAAEMPESNAYHRANYPGLPGLVIRLVKNAARSKPA